MIVLMKHMINKTARPNIVFIVEDIKDKATDPFVFYQAIKQALIAGEGSAEFIRAKCNAITGIDFNHGYDFLMVKRLFGDLFLKFKSKNRNVGFTGLEKVKFLTKLYERCNHSAVSNLSDTLKNAIFGHGIKRQGYLKTKNPNLNKKHQIWFKLDICYHVTTRNPLNI